VNRRKATRDLYFRDELQARGAGIYSNSLYFLSK